MKNIYYLVLLLAVSMIISCNKGKDNDTEPDDNFKDSDIFIGNTSKVFEISSQISDSTIPSFIWFNEKDQKDSLIHYKGKPIMINFWATWCGPCLSELPAFLKLKEQYKESGLLILGISIDREKTLSELSVFVKEEKINYQVLLDDGMLAGAFGEITQIPTTFFIDKNFKIVEKYIGSMNEKTLKNKIEKIL